MATTHCEGGLCAPEGGEKELSGQTTICYSRYDKNVGRSGEHFRGKPVDMKEVASDKARKVARTHL